MPQQRGALENLYLVHAQGGGKVVSRRIGIRRRRDQHTVFHKRDLRAALRARAAQADVGSEPEALFFLEVDARHLAQHAQDIRRIEYGKFLGVDEMSRTRYVGNIGLAADYGDRLDRLEGCCVVAGGEGAGGGEQGGNGRKANNYAASGRFHELPRSRNLSMLGR